MSEGERKFSAVEAHRYTLLVVVGVNVAGESARVRLEAQLARWQAEEKRLHDNYRTMKARAAIKDVAREAIDPAKDVDGLTPVSTGRLALGLPGLVPCTPLGSLMLLKDRLGELSGLNAVVIGRSILVGKPMAQLLLAESCTVTIAHSRTRDLPEVVRRADIVVAAVGRAEMVKGDWLKPGATVIDVGINRLPPVDGENRGRLVGDVDFASAAEVAGAITPVPGGVGPMTIAVLLRNTLVAAHRNAGVTLAQDAL